MNKIFLTLLVFLTASVVVVDIYSFVIDIEPRDLWHEYTEDMGDQEDPSTFGEWLEEQDNATDRFADWLGDGADASFNPWYENKDY